MPRRRRRNRNTEREKARRESGKLLRARYLKPERCETCNKKTKYLAGHHYRESWASLYARGLALIVEAHEIIYLCRDCHYEAHKHEPWAHLLRQRGRRRRKAKKKG